MASFGLSDKPHVPGPDSLPGWTRPHGAGAGELRHLGHFWPKGVSTRRYFLLRNIKLPPLGNRWACPALLGAQVPLPSGGGGSSGSEMPPRSVSPTASLWAAH